MDQIDKYLEEIQEVTGVEIAGGVLIYLGISAAVFLSQLAMIFATFASFMKSAKKNSELTRRVNKVMKTSGWEVVVMKHNMPNAFAIKGKTIFITNQLFKLINKDEVIAVALHEVGHLAGNHVYYRSVASSLKFGVVLPCFVFPPLAWFLLLSLTFVQNRTIGRYQENVADSYATKYGYGDQLISALQKMEKYINKMAPDNPIARTLRKIQEVFDEHPPVRERVERILKEKESIRVIMSGNVKKIKAHLTKKFSMT